MDQICLGAQQLQSNISANKYTVEKKLKLKRTVHIKVLELLTELLIVMLFRKQVLYILRDCMFRIIFLKFLED
jgi:hypothetical protein